MLDPLCGTEDALEDPTLEGGTQEEELTGGAVEEDAAGTAASGVDLPGLVQAPKVKARSTAGQAWMRMEPSLAAVGR